MREKDDHLIHAICQVLVQLERQNDIVICSDDPTIAAKKIATQLDSVVLDASLTLEELGGVRSLIYHAIADKRFFDWKMPTLTGFTADEFKAVAKKLPRHI
ncbi:MAG: hypothetical protein ABF248_09295 [Yoonia sp.]